MRECQRLYHSAVVAAAVPEPPKPATVTAPARSTLGDLFPTNDFFDPVMTGAWRAPVHGLTLDLITVFRFRRVARFLETL